MDNEKEQRIYKFQKLTPYEKTDMEGYEQSLDFVFENKNGDLRNIALTGNYGSGKSSVMRSYAENHKELSFIYVSLAHFEGVSGETDEENYDVNVEEKIINHIVQQIPHKNIPDSGFRIKRNFNVARGICLAIRIAVLLCVMTYLNAWNILHEIQGVKLWELLTGSAATAIILCVGFVNLTSIIYSAVNSLNTRKKIKSLKFQNGTVEFSDESEKSYFDQHLDEILYLLAEAKVDAVVFEDIDRFKEIDLKVLEHLRELCTLANDRIHNIDEKRKPLRFVYLIGDYVFKQHTDRTKFFDYIIPVIPVVDASNSYAKMREFLEKSGDYDKLDDRFLRGLCLYIDDLRTIKNIVNEFQIYSSKLSMTAKNANQLMALIVYKNLYPDDFSDLQRERGYLYRVLCSKESVIASRIKSIEDEIDDLKKKVEVIEKEALYSTEELDAVKRERQNHPNYFTDGYSQDEWNNKIYPVRSKYIKARSSNESKKIREEIVERQKLLTHIRNSHLSDLITENEESEVFGYATTGRENGLPIREKKDNQLVEFFIKNGHIDETTYRDYIALFYEKGMSYRDKDFLISVNSHNGKPFDYEIQDKQLVIENLKPADFIQPETRNFSVTDYILECNLDEYIQKFVFQLQENTDYEFIAQYLRVAKDRLKFIKALNKYWTESMVTLISSENQDMTLEEIQDYVITSVAHIGESELKNQNRDNLITIYINEKLVDASCDSKDCEAIGDSLLVLDAELPDIDKQVNSDELRAAIYERDLYALNRRNVESILKSEYGLNDENIHNRELTAVCSDSEQSFYDYVNRSIAEFIENIVLEDEEIQDDLDVSEYVLNSENVSEELKEQYISLMSEAFKSLENINEGQWKNILINRKVICVSDEILRFYKKFGLTEELVEFINAAEEDIDYASYDDENTLNKFFDASVKNSGLDNDHYREIMQQIGRQLTSFNITGIGDKKVNILVEEGLMPMNLSNLQFIRQAYPSVINIFVESDVNGYLGLLQGNNFVPDEALKLIGDRRIDIESRQKLVDMMTTTITIKDLDYDDEIIRYIIIKKYNANDMPYLLENYRNYSNETQEVIYKKLKSQVAFIKSNLAVIATNKELLWRIFEDNSISVAEKSNIMDLLITDHADIDLEVLLQKMGFSNMTKLVSGDNTRLPNINNGAEEKAVLNVLKKHDYITDYSVDEDNNTIKVERKRLFAGGKHGR